MNSRRLIIIGTILAVGELIVFRIWVYNEQPDPSVSIGELLIIPVLFGANILIGASLYFLKQRHISRLFFINSLVASIIFHLVWISWYAGWTDRNYTIYSFTVGQQNYELSISKTQDYFFISDITNKPNGSTTGLFMGEFKVVRDSIILTEGQTKMVLINSMLIGLPDHPNEIVLTKTTN